MDIIKFIENDNLIGDKNLSLAQKTILKSMYGEPLTKAELKIYRKLTGLRNGLTPKI